MLMINGYFTHPLFKLSLFGSIFLGCNITEVSLNQFVLAQNVIPTQIESNTNSTAKQVIYVNSNQGNDQNGTGSPDSPFKTITQALMIASPPQNQIILAEGKYSTATGETFPIIISQPLTIKGNPQNYGKNVIIEGDGFFVSRGAGGQNVAIAVLHNATIEGVTISNLNSRGHGVWLESSNAQIFRNTFTNNSNTGLSVNGNANPLIRENYFINNIGNGILIYDMSTPIIQSNSFQGNGFGLSASRNSQAVVTNNLFKNNRTGIILEGESQTTLRKNQILDSTEIGLIAISAAVADLGTSEDLGENNFGGNRLFDIKNNSNQTIMAVGNQIYGKVSENVDLQGIQNPINLAQANSINSPSTQGISIDIIPPSPSSSTTNTTTNQNQPIPNIPPLPTSTPAQETLTITGNSTPQRVLSVNGNPIASDKSLPTPPPLSEPYRKPEIENESIEIINNTDTNEETETPSVNNVRVNPNSINNSPNPVNNYSNTQTNNNYEQNTVETVSISPFDQTPTDEPIISNSNQSATSNININTKNPNPATEVKTQPTNNTKISPSPSPSSSTNNNNSQRYANSQQKRRTLSDILVFSGNNNNQNNSTKKPVNNNSAIATNNSNSYKVLVPFTSQFTETQVKSLYPDAFTTQYQGKNFLQVGLFNSKQNAEQVRQSLRNYGLNSILLP